MDFECVTTEAALGKNCKYGFKQVAMQPVRPNR